MTEGDDVREGVQDAVVASLNRLGELMAEVTATTRELTAIRDAATKKVIAATGRRELADPAILAEVAAAMDERAPRFATVITWIENEAPALDAATTRWLDYAEQSLDDPGTQAVLAAMSRMGTLATSLAETQQRTVDGLDALADHEVLRRPAGRHAASLERLLAATRLLAPIGARSQRLLDKGPDRPA